VAAAVSEAVVTSLKEGKPDLDEYVLSCIRDVMIAPHKHKHRKLRKTHATLQPSARQYLSPSYILSLPLSYYSLFIVIRRINTIIETYSMY